MRGACGFVLFASIALAGCSAQRGLRVDLLPEPDSQAWWLRTTFEPHGTRVRGMPVQRIDPTWCEASELTLEAFPEAARHGTSGLDGNFAGGRSGFSARGEFGGRPLEIVLGVFASCDGERGSFMLVLATDREASAADRLLQVETIAVPPAFVYVAGDPANERIYVRSCFQCDHIGAWSWDAVEARFVRQPEPDFS